MMISERGQSAVEYMMTYGWAILVVLVAGILLWQLGFLEIGRNTQPDKRGFSQVTPLDWGLGQSGDLALVIQNNAGTIVKIQPVGTDAYIIAGGSGDGHCTSNGIAAITDLRPGATMSIAFTGCPMESGMRIGDYYRVNVTISYQNPASGLPHKSNGIIWGPIG